MKFVGLAKIWWYTIDEYMTKKRQPTTETWDKMKTILCEKFLPPN